MIHRKLMLRAGILLLGVSLLATGALLHGCAARVPAGRAGTPIENALADNASLADANLSVANAVIAAQKNGLISVNGAARVLTAQSMVADGDRQLTILMQTLAVQLQSNPGATIDAARVKALLAQITTAATGLVSSGDIGIKDANTQKTVISSMNSIAQFAGNIASTLTVAGLVK